MRAGLTACLALLLVAPLAAAYAPPRARDLAVPFDGGILDTRSAPRGAGQDHPFSRARIR